MSDVAGHMGLSDAARHLGVSVRALRHAMRVGSLPSPAGLTATSRVPAAWVEEAKAALEATPAIAHAVTKQRVPPFARYAGTSAWRKYGIRVREYAAFRAG